MRFNHWIPINALLFAFVLFALNTGTLPIGSDIPVTNEVQAKAAEVTVSGDFVRLHHNSPDCPTDEELEAMFADTKIEGGGSKLFEFACGCRLMLVQGDANSTAASDAPAKAPPHPLRDSLPCPTTEDLKAVYEELNLEVGEKANYVHECGCKFVLLR